jgi:hypothetical protein
MINNSKFKGDLNMFGTNFDYMIKFTNVTQSKFNFHHEISQDENVVDSKNGEGSIEVVDENILKLKYRDPETEFEAKYNINSKEIEGNTRQVSSFLGMYNGSTGTFQLKFESAENSEDSL